MATFESYFGLFLATEYAYDEARVHLDRAIALDPQSSVVHFHVASALCLMGDAGSVERHAGRALELSPENLGARWPQMSALVTEGRLDEAIALAEQVVARARAPIFLGALGMVYGRAGRLADAKRLLQELDERQGRGEYIVPVARLSIALGLADIPGIRRALAACIDGGAAPLAVASTNRLLVDAHREDAEIDRLLDRLNDGARPWEPGSRVLRF